MQPAHYPGKSDGCILRIGDDQIRCFKPSLVAVKRGERFVAACHANNEASVHRLQVVCMVRLIELKIHKIRNVDNVVDGSHSCPRKSLLDPCWRFGNDDPRHGHDGKPAATIRRLDLNWNSQLRAEFANLA